MRSLTLAFVTTVVGISACSSDSGSTGPGDPGGSPTPSPVTYSGVPMPSPATDSGVPTPSPAPDSGVATLTVMNFLNWCSVEINGGTASTGATVTASVTPGSMATVVATPASSSFQIGTDPWFGVDQNDGGAASGTDVGSGTSETSTATVTIPETGTTQCVSVCCQEPGNSPIPCPTTNPCQ
jgi:hypothetical protein